MSQRLELPSHNLEVPNEYPLPSKSDWSIGMVGFGRHARKVHLPDFREVGWSVPAIAAPSESTRRVAEEQFDIIRTYADYNQLIDDPQVEIIDVVTQPSVREEVVTESLRAGKATIVEKPFGLNMNECKRMVQVAKEEAVPLGVHQNYRWMKGNYLTNQIIDNDLIGSPYLIEFSIYGSRDSRLSDHSYYSNCEHFLPLHWDIHLFDLLRYWFDRDVMKVQAHTARADEQSFESDMIHSAWLEIRDGIQAHIFHTEIADQGTENIQCRIEGSDGSLRFDFNGERMEIASSRFNETTFSSVGIDKINYTYPLNGSMGNFLKAVEENRTPSVSGDDNLSTMSIALSVIESIEANGSWVEIN